jgi:hypothetical protein
MIPVALVGLVVPLILRSGLLISTFCVMPKAALAGLLLSDFLHLALQGPWQKESRRVRVGDEEMGSEKSLCLAPEGVPTDVPRMEVTVQQQPVCST